MVKGDAFAIDIRTLFADAHPKLHGKCGVVWCIGPAGKDWPRIAA